MRLSCTDFKIWKLVEDNCKLYVFACFFIVVINIWIFLFIRLYNLYFLRHTLKKNSWSHHCPKGTHSHDPFIITLRIPVNRTLYMHQPQCRKKKHSHLHWIFSSKYLLCIMCVPRQKVANFLVYTLNTIRAPSLFSHPLCFHINKTAIT